MPRRPRQASASGYYHFINRGVNHNPLFYAPEDYDHYKALLKQYADRFGIQILHYCFLSNHTHALIRADDVSRVSLLGHFLHRRYAYYLCRVHELSEQIFKKHFVSKPIEDEAYLLECARYIERNPVRAGMVTDPAEYPYSSYPFYAMGTSDSLLETNPLYAGLGYDDRERRVAYRAYVRSTRPSEMEVVV